jgi:hypothetical protein
MAPFSLLYPPWFHTHDGDFVFCRGLLQPFHQHPDGRLFDQAGPANRRTNRRVRPNSFQIFRYPRQISFCAALFPTVSVGRATQHDSGKAGTLFASTRRASTASPFWPTMGMSLPRHHQKTKGTVINLKWLSILSLWVKTHTVIRWISPGKIQKSGCTSASMISGIPDVRWALWRRRWL